MWYTLTLMTLWKYTYYDLNKDNKPIIFMTIESKWSPLTEIDKLCFQQTRIDLAKTKGITVTIEKSQ